MLHFKIEIQIQIIWRKEKSVSFVIKYYYSYFGNVIIPVVLYYVYFLFMLPLMQQYCVYNLQWFINLSQ